MKALVYSAPLQMTMEDLPEPVAGPGQELIQVAAAGICGSELEGFANQSPMRVPPLVMGHEFSGIRVSDGARVTVNPLSACGSCDLCTHERPNLCAQRRLLGVHDPGGFAERVVVPRSQCVEIPHEASLAQAAMIEPLANAVHALRVAHDPDWPVRSLGVIGAGALGSAVVLAAVGTGVSRIDVADRVPARLALVEAAGATSVGESVGNDLDLVIDCVGSTETRRVAVAALRPGGTVVLLGLHDAELELNGQDLTRSEKRVIGTFAYAPGDFEAAARLCSRVPDTWFDEVPLADGVDVWHRLLAGPGAVPKTLLLP